MSMNIAYMVKLNSHSLPYLLPRTCRPMSRCAWRWCGDALLAVVDQHLQHFAPGENQSRYGELGIAQHELVLDMRGASAPGGTGC
jgi:hypothetical protein